MHVLLIIAVIIIIIILINGTYCELVPVMVFYLYCTHQIPTTTFNDRYHFSILYTGIAEAESTCKFVNFFTVLEA